MIRVALFALFMITLIGCDRDEPNPELRDPIFADLKKQHERHAGIVKEEKKNLDELIKDLAKAEPNSMEIKNIRRTIARTEHTITDSEQWARYYRIRMERRKVVDKIQAREARLNNQKWPDPREYSDYQVSSRLRSADRSWEEGRVPKLADRIPKAPKSEKSFSSPNESSE